MPRMGKTEADWNGLKLGFYLYNKDLEIFKRFFKEQIYQWEYYPVTNDSIQHLHYALQQFAPFLPELIVQAA